MAFSTFRDRANPIVAPRAEQLKTPALQGARDTAKTAYCARRSPGQLVFVGNLSLSSTSDYEVELNGTTAGTLYDQADVMGGVSLGGGALSVSLGYSANTGDQYTIINNDLADAVSGTFGGLPEGSSLFVGGINEFQISYMGGDGNDVVLTFLVPEPSSAALLALAGATLVWRRRRG